MIKKINTHSGTVLTAIADPIELDPMAVRSVRGDLGHPLIQGLVNRQFQVDDRTASLTDEVVVGPDVGIEAIEGAAEIDFLDQSLIYQDVEVAVDCTHAQVRELPFQPFVYPVCRRMTPRAPQKLEDPLPLPASLVLAASCDDPTPVK